MLGDHDGHRHYEDLAVRHVMGSLDSGQSGAFRTHLLDCHDCRARVGELRSIASDLADVERAERRERAARLVETKEREAETDDDVEEADEPTGGPSRLVAFIGIGLIIALSAWVFVLRTQNAELFARASVLAESTAVINFGEAWSTEHVVSGYEGMVRSGDDSLAVVLTGADADQRYTIILYDLTGRVLLTGIGPELVDGQLRWFRTLPNVEVGRVEVTVQRDGGDTVVFRAASPPALVAPATD